jgi:hypothetical protein
MTATEACQEARAYGMTANRDTVRRIARQSGLAIKLGRQIFINRAGWLQLLETGHPDPMAEREKTRTSAPSKA